jgi:rubrerythrin
MDKTEKFFAAFKLAIDEEQKAHDLYVHLAELCEEEDLKTLFNEFAADELEHKTILMDKYKALKNN